MKHAHALKEACHPLCPAYGEMMISKTATRVNADLAQNDRGEWVPAIPEPYFLSFGMVRCDCGQKRRGRSRYREHFALAHILGFGL